MVQAETEVLGPLRDEGFVLLDPERARAVLALEPVSLAAFSASWQLLPRDGYLKDGGSYRARRHSCFIQAAGEQTTAVPHRAHWQPTAYNALHGGLLRWFEPITDTVRSAPAFSGLLGALGTLFRQLRPVPRWYIEAHQFRIDTQGGIGRPTPEGAHRDGVDFVAVILVRRNAITGGETRVFPAQGSSGVRFTMREPWSMLLMDDARVIHETTPIQARNGYGFRDTLVLTYRAAGFQAPATAGE
jgi:hypothetical protein